MTEVGESGRKITRMTVRQARAEMNALLPEVEALAARFKAISDHLDAGDPTNKFVFGRPGRDHLRYFVACGAEVMAEELLELADHVRKREGQTHADLLARWEERQKREAALKNRTRNFPFLLDLG